jgi:hypothetical protein
LIGTVQLPSEKHTMSAAERIPMHYGHVTVRLAVQPRQCPLPVQVQPVRPYCTLHSRRGPDAPEYLHLSLPSTYFHSVSHAPVVPYWHVTFPDVTIRAHAAHITLPLWHSHPLSSFCEYPPELLLCCSCTPARPGQGHVTAVPPCTRLAKVAMTLKTHPSPSLLSCTAVHLLH